MNNRGQFSIIAALFVAVILVSSVVMTYSTIRYNTNQDSPQILSAVDETNLALKQVLGFTVGYYGSVLQVTGNSSYAYGLSSNYLNSGLANIADIRPEWSASFAVNSLVLGTNWFMNESFSKGELKISYSLAGLGIWGVSYTASCRLDVQIVPSSTNQVSVNVVKDEATPLTDLGLKSFKFYLYARTNLTWVTVNPPNEPTSFTNGTYLLDIPEGINPRSYTIQVQDERGITVAASSFSHLSGSLTFNSTSGEGGDYVDNFNSAVDGVSDVGLHGAFASQQVASAAWYDTMSEANVGVQTQDYFPDQCNLQGGTSILSGSLSALTQNDSSYMRFQSYATAYSSSQYSTITYDGFASTTTDGANSLSWNHATGTGSNRILLISIDTFNYNAAPATVSSVTYGSTPITSSLTARYSTDPQVRSYVFYLVNPSSGTNQITVTFSSQTAAICGSVTYVNVNQTSPVLTTATANGRSANPSVSLSASGSYNKLLIGHLGGQTSSGTFTINEGGGQQTRWTNSGTYRHGSTTYYCAGRGSELTVMSGSATMSWTTSRTVDWVAIALLLQPTQLPTQETLQLVFSGASNTFNWNRLTWALDASASTSVGAILQLFDYNAGQFAVSGSGYLTDTFGAADKTAQQTIAAMAGAANFRDVIGRWQLSLTATVAASAPFTFSMDLARFRTESNLYAVQLEEQWTGVNMTDLNTRPTLCINSSAAAPDLSVEAWTGASWQTISSSLVSGWNNLSVSSYLTSPVFTIRFQSDADTGQTSWQIGAVLLRPASDQQLFESLQDPSATVTVELLQNGSLRWLGQNLQLDTEAVPIPPIPVKALHVNETVNGVNKAVPFQVEDWGSGYTIPLGMTNNATVFGNRQMVVFLVNTRVSEFTIWWNGSDEAVQTPLAFTNQYFSFVQSSRTVSNTHLTLQFASTGFTVTSTTAGSASSSAKFMRINNLYDNTDPEYSYVITNGVVRDIVLGESEYSGGAGSCTNVYTSLVFTLPANASYYTYQTRLFFINSDVSRTVTDLCPVSLSSSGQLQTENGTILGDPVVAAGSQTFNSTAPWGHHWSQFTDGTKGAGIMFTNSSNQLLYAFDTPTILRGALKADATTPAIQVLPVTLNSIAFQNSLTISWTGAVTTFDANVTPIYSGPGQPGLWVLAELPPMVAVRTEN
jgi:hypothetical protein